ncbi:hypothetical protein M2338_000381 [Sphingobium sp. B2D3B]|nr:hypothetical protein [Sphingobium sp. B2D3B]
MRYAVPVAGRAHERAGALFDWSLLYRLLA